MNELCGVFGKSRQAYYQRNKYEYKERIKSEILLQLVAKQREKMPRLGGRKLIEIIQPGIPQELRLGRDLFFDFLRQNGLLIRKRRRKVRTTYSNHWLHKYPNLIKEFTPERAQQLWVSDITYVETNEGFCYLNLITDAYSRKIIGWQVGDTLEAKHTVKALKMALDQLPARTKDLIHHSDRGVQYCCEEYVKFLNQNHIKISMTEDGDPRENAIAERVNGILKDEWLNQMKLQSKLEVIQWLEQIIRIYNQDRPHSSLGMKTPAFAHVHNTPLTRRWKTYPRRKMNPEEIWEKGVGLKSN